MHGSARSSSSSYIAPGHLDSGANVSLDFLAMRSGGAKKLVEYDPPIVPLRYLDLGGTGLSLGRHQHDRRTCRNR